MKRQKQKIIKLKKVVYLDMKKAVPVILIVALIFVISACDIIPGVGGSGSNRVISSLTLGQTFELNDFEITLSEDIGFTRLVSPVRDRSGAYVFYIPITLTNIGSVARELNLFYGIEEQRPFLLTVFSPDGISMSGRVEVELYTQHTETNVLAVRGRVQPGETMEKNIYIMYTEDGEYVIEFTDVFDDEIKELKFMFELDYDAFPRTDFGLGETIDWGGLEITVASDIIWKVVDREWSEHYGEHYFLLHVTVTNNSDEDRWFPGSYDCFDPNGHSLPRLIITGSDRDDIVMMSSQMSPGASKAGYFYLLYAGDGEYTLQFRNWELPDINVRFRIRHNPNDLP